MGHYIIFIALVAAMGGFIYGVDSGIISTTLGHRSFKVYMLGPSESNPALIGAIVSLYNTGQAVGTLIAGYSADKFSRRWTIWGAAIISSLGATIEAGSQDAVWMTCGRFLAGSGCGILLSVVPVYIAEVSPRERRGAIVGLQGMMISVGFFLANWIGYCGDFANGDMQWRIPLLMQLPGPLVLAIGCFFIPYSPLWLVEKQRYDEAKKVLLALHGNKGEYYLLKEFMKVRDQIEFERTVKNGSIMGAASELFSRRYIRRTATACFILMMGQLSGSNVFQNYQNIFYGTVGLQDHNALLVSGFYGIVGVIGQVIYLAFVADKWLRTRTLWVGSLFLCAMVTVSMILSSQSNAGENSILSYASIGGIFMYSCGYSVFFNAMVWVVPSELFPFFLRSKGLGFAVLSRAVVGIALAQITPIALQNIGWKYYAVFIATNFIAAFVYFFFLPETNGKSLEEIAELFGDTLISEQPSRIGIRNKKRLVIDVSSIEKAEWV